MFVNSVVSIARFLKRSWGWILAVVVVTAGFANLGMKWLAADSDAESACRYFDSAMAIARMHELRAQDGPMTPAEEKDLLESCNRILRAYAQWRFVTVTGERTWAACDRAQFGSTIERAASPAALEVLERDPEARNRASARNTIIHLTAASRIDDLLYRDNTPRPRLDNYLTQNPAHERQFDAYLLAGWYCEHGQSDKALAKLRLALGDSWFRTGQTDEWMSRNLHLGSEQHLWIGYVLHKTGHADQALREFRKAYGAHMTKSEMQGVYLLMPDVKL